MEIKLPILEKSTIENLIPQKAPFVMVDKLISYEEGNLTAGFEVVTDNIFTNLEVFQEPGLVEHMAQSVALYTGYQYFLRNEDAPTGYIGTIKNIDIVRLPRLGEKIVTSVNILQEFMGVTLVDIVSTIDEIEIAKAQMKTVIAS